QPADGRIPSGALLKAVLLNSTILTDSGVPEDRSGWGVANLPATLFFEGGPRRLVVRDIRHAEGLATGQNGVLAVNVQSDIEPLRVTLVWTEPPGGIGAANSVVNDLDLEVTSPTGARLLGNVYQGGHSVEGGSADRVNNVEMVSVERPIPGEWTIRLAAIAVNVGTPGQGYAVVASGDLLPPTD
ncbi:MAG: hypothetical protein M3144_08030, partial [Actinomycetota bacterium]|nr:hypothetical protein [Actinomycetota bacterium]